FRRRRVVRRARLLASLISHGRSLDGLGVRPSPALSRPGSAASALKFHDFAALALHGALDEIAPTRKLVAPAFGRRVPPALRTPSEGETSTTARQRNQR